MRFEDPPTTEDFEYALGRRLLRARAEDEAGMEVNAGDLHREVGGYPGDDHRMPTCCSVLRKAMVDKDDVVDAPPAGDGASLTVRFDLS